MKGHFSTGSVGQKKIGTQKVLTIIVNSIVFLSKYSMVLFVWTLNK